MKYFLPFISCLLLMVTASYAVTEAERKPLNSLISRSGDQGLQLQSILPYNGRIWQNIYYAVEGDPFLFSREFIEGKLTMRGTTFSKVKLRFDIYSNEIQIPVPAGGILQLNKEMVDSFSLKWEGRWYDFVSSRLSSDSEPLYLNLLYRGKTLLLRKYEKGIERARIETERDKFYAITKIFIVHDGRAYFVRRKSDLTLTFSDRQDEMRQFIRSSGLSVKGSRAEELIPLLKFYDSLKN